MAAPPPPPPVPFPPFTFAFNGATHAMRIDVPPGRTASLTTVTAAPPAGVAPPGRHTRLMTGSALGGSLMQFGPSLQGGTLVTAAGAAVVTLNNPNPPGGANMLWNVEVRYNDPGGPVGGVATDMTVGANQTNFTTTATVAIAPLPMVATMVGNPSIILHAVVTFT